MRCVVPLVSVSLAAGSVAASSNDSSGIPPFMVLIVVGLVLFSTFVNAASRKRAANRKNAHHQPSAPASRVGVAHQPQRHGAQPVTNAPYVGTLLNGVPMHNDDAGHGHQTAGFANERMRAESELKRQLDALDTARRNGQVTAEQYAVHREAIFKNF